MFQEYWFYPLLIIIMVGGGKLLTLKGDSIMKKYDKIMGAFGKTADKLMALNEANAEKATRLIAKVDEIEAEIASVAAEASQAYLMAEKIKEFMEI